nr:hypothetical protein [Tanacetum cinerariifolium]
MSSPNHPTFNIEDAFSSNFPDYTMASPRNISPDPPDNLSNFPFASLAISPFHNVQACNAVANKPPIPPQDPITPPTILTPSSVPPSLLFDPLHFFIPEELLPPKKQIHPPSSSSTTLSNSSRKQACILVPPSSSTYTPTPPQIYELEKSYINMRVMHYEKQVESILRYLEELPFHYIEKMEERLINGWIIIPRDFDEVKNKLKEARTQIRELQKKRMGQRDNISFIHFRISDLEMTLEDIQDRHQLYVKNHVGHTSVIEGVVQSVAPNTADQRLARKNELKARGTLLMALPDKHQLKFNIHKDTKSLMEAIEKRFSGNKVTKKVQKTLLKQQYENFTSLSSESLDQIHDRLQKLISQLEILGESLSQEDINLKFLRSLPTKWRTHTLIWRNKTYLEDQIRAVASVSAASTKVPVYALLNVDTSSDAIIYSFFATQFNSSQLNNDDLKQIDITGRNLGANETTSIGFDMSKVKCYNCHRRGHFTRECRSPKDTRNKEVQRRNVPVETSTSNALVSQCDGVGSYDWRFQAEEEPTNYALMAFTSSSSSSSDNEVALCSKACTKAYATLQSHYDKLTNDLRKSQFDILSYKTGLEYVKARILVYQQNETVFKEDIKLLKLDVNLRDNALVKLRKKFKKAEQERDELGYDNQVFNSSVFNRAEMFSSESDVIMLASPLYDRYNSREGYHVVPPPYTGTFMPPKPDLVFHDAPTVNKTVPTVFNVELSPTKHNKDLSHSNRPSAPLIEDWVSDSEDDSEGEPMHTQITPSFIHPTEQVKTPRPSVKPACSSNSSLNRSRIVLLTTARPVTTAVLPINVTRARPAKTGVTKPHLQLRRPINHRPSPNPSTFPQKLLLLRLHKLMLLRVSKGTGHMTGNMSYLSDFKEINGGYVAFGGNPKGGKITDTACIVLSSDFKLPDENHNRVLLTKPHNMTPYELLLGRTPSIGFMRPFGCPVTILNTLDPLGKFDRKDDEGFLVGYSVSSKAFRVFNSRTKIVQEALHINFLENQPNVAGSRPTWLFDIDTLTKSINYQPVLAGNQPNPSAGIQEHFDADKAEEGNVQQYVLFPLWYFGSKDPQNTNNDATFEVKEPESEVYVSSSRSAKTKKHDDKNNREAKGKSPVELSTRVRNLSEEFEDFYDNRTNEVNAVSTLVLAIGQNSTNNTNIFSAAGPSNTAENTITVSPISTTRVHKDHPMTQIIGDLSSATQTRSMTRMVKDQVARMEAIRLFLAYDSFMGFMVYQMDVKSAFLYGTIEEEVYFCQPLGFDDLDYPDKVYKVVKALDRLHQALRAWYETLANYLLENGFQRGKINQTLFIQKQKGDILLVQVYVDDIIFGSTNKNLCKAFEKLMKDKFQMSSIAEILRKFRLTDGKSASTPIDNEKPLLKDPDGEDVDVHTYMSMIGSLMYLTSSRPDIMLAVCVCAHFQVTPKASHLHAVKRIFRYLKGKPHLGLCIDFLPNEEIFDALERMGYEKPSTKLTFYKAFFSAQWKFLIHTILQCMSAKRTAWNEFSSSMASAIIYLAIGMLVPQQAHDDVANDDVADDVADNVADVVADADAEPTPPSPTPDITPPQPQQEVTSTPPPSPPQSPIAPSSSPPKQQQPSQPTTISIDLLNTLRMHPNRGKIAEMDANKDVTLEEVAAEVEKDAEVTKDAELTKLKEVIEVVTTAKLMTEVVTAAATTITVVPSAARKRKGVVIRDPKETATPSIIVHSEPKSKDKGKGILVEEPKSLKKQDDVIEQVKRKEKQDNAVLRYQALKRKPQTEARARKNIMVYLKNMVGFQMDFFKGMSYDDIRPIFKKHFNFILGFLEKSEKELEEEASKGLKWKSKSSEQQAAKKQKLDEEVKELKTHLQIVPNDEDNVYTKATRLALKRRLGDAMANCSSKVCIFRAKELLR